MHKSCLKRKGVETTQKQAGTKISVKNIPRYKIFIQAKTLNFRKNRSKNNDLNGLCLNLLDVK
jgi:hypothetical protein